MAFITNNTFRRILPKYERRLIPNNSSLDEIYKVNLRHILSEPELGLLYILKEAYENHEFALEKYRKIIPEDNKKLVFVSKNPSYHYLENCEALKSSFENFEIPEEIRQKGDNAIQDFRDFFQENKYLLKEKPDVFMMRLRNRFNMETTPVSINYENSGEFEIQDLTLNILENRIRDLLFDAEKFRTRDPETERLIYEKGYGTHTVPEAKDKSHVLYEWHKEYKGGLKYLLGEYFRVRLNPELSFDGNLLDQLGLKPCKICHPTENELT